MRRHASKSTGGAKAGAFPGKVRVIGGQWRGRRIAVPPLPALRPSPDRVRETLFNWLQAKIVGARCLDLFAGSGVLGIEALSRGASRVVFVDREPAVARHLKDTLHALDAGSAAQVEAADALRYLDGKAELFDVVFLDPPFTGGLLAPVCARLAVGWLAPGAYIYLESSAATDLPPLPASWAVHRSDRAGQVGYHLLRTQLSSRGFLMPGALYPGSFDPITNGHYDLVRRAANIFDRVVVAIAANPGKAPLFTVEERVELARKVCADIPNVDVTSFKGLTVDFAVQCGLRVVVRGLRAVSDFDFEFQLATMSRHLSDQVDYVFLTPMEQFNFISSTLVREIASHNGNVSQFVHPVVEAALKQAWAKRRT